MRPAGRRRPAPVGQAALVPAAGKWLPYNLQVFQRKQLMLSIDYNEADEIEINVFRRGPWEDRMPPIVSGTAPRQRSRIR